MFFLKKRGPPSKRRDFDKQKKVNRQKEGTRQFLRQKEGIFPKKMGSPPKRRDFDQNRHFLRQKEGIFKLSAKKTGKWGVPGPQHRILYRIFNRWVF